MSKREQQLLQSGKISVNDARKVFGLSSNVLDTQSEKSGFPTVNLEITPARIRQIHKSLFSTKDALSTQEAEAFLLLYSEQLADTVNDAVREFIKEKLK